MNKRFAVVFVFSLMILLALLFGVFFYFQERLTLQEKTTFWAGIILVFLLTGVVTISLFLRRTRKVYK